MEEIMQGDLLKEGGVDQPVTTSPASPSVVRHPGSAYVTMAAGKIITTLGRRAEEVLSAGQKHDQAVGRMTSDIARYGRELSPEVMAELERQGRARGHISPRHRVTDGIDLLIHLTRSTRETTLARSSWSKIAAVARHAVREGLSLAEGLTERTVWELYREIKSQRSPADAAAEEDASQPDPDTGTSLTLHLSADERAQLEAGDWELVVALRPGGEVVRRMVQVLAHTDAPVEQLPSIVMQAVPNETQRHGAAATRQARVAGNAHPSSGVASARQPGRVRRRGAKETQDSALGA
jgi:hypothetical protein